MLTRRRLLSTTGLTAAAAALLGGAAPARALSEQPAPWGDVQALRQARETCRAVSSHDQMLAVLQAELEKGARLTAAERARVMATATCPTCGQLLRG